MVNAVHGGSPAWAGIDPLEWLDDVNDRRSPRVGGDRPTDGMAGIAPLVVPPRGRGIDRRRGFRSTATLWFITVTQLRQTLTVLLVRAALGEAKLEGSSQLGGPDWTKSRTDASSRTRVRWHGDGVCEGGLLSHHLDALEEVVDHGFTLQELPRSGDSAGSTSASAASNPCTRLAHLMGELALLHVRYEGAVVNSQRIGCSHTAPVVHQFLQHIPQTRVLLAPVGPPNPRWFHISTHHQSPPLLPTAIQCNHSAIPWQKASIDSLPRSSIFREKP